MATSSLNGAAARQPPSSALVDERRCSRCRQNKAMVAFHRTVKRGRPGFSYTCRSCHAAYKVERVARLAAERSTRPVPTEKMCSKCKGTRPIPEFGKHAGNVDGFNHFCRQCATKVQVDSTRMLRKFVADLKSERPCLDCGRILPFWVMQFDHRDASTKLFQIGAAAGHSVRGKPKLLEEIAKCDLVCATCHAHRTYCRRKGMAHFVLEEID